MLHAVLRRAIQAIAASLIQIIEHTQTARRPGVGGIILFSHVSLGDATHGPGVSRRWDAPPSSSES